jgi:DNA-binding NarL/FixJ family response regulator
MATRGARDSQARSLPELVVVDLRHGCSEAVVQLRLRRFEIPALALERAVLGEVELDGEDADVTCRHVRILPPWDTIRGMALRLVLAEDSYLVREGVGRLLATQPEVEVAAACGTLSELLDAVETSGPDVVVTDIKMPPTHSDEGIRAADQIQAAHPDVGIVVLSQYAAPDYALALFDRGSAGRAYLLKERVADIDELLRAIRAVAAGGSAIDPKVVDVLIEARTRALDSPLGALTRREREILAEMATGKSNAAIAESLVLTERAVEKHTNAIFSKLGLTYERDVNKRVKAVLIYLSSEEG